MATRTAALAVALLAACGARLAHSEGRPMAPAPRQRWSKQQARAWYDEAGAIRGCNYLPATAVNSTEMWQADTFDPETIDRELGWARRAGYNSVRAFLQFLVWKHDPKGLAGRFERFLAIAHRHGIRTMPVFFCDCSFAGKEPYLGKQDDPVPGVHNSGWTPSPGLKRVADRAAWPELAAYVKAIVARHAEDPRVLVWDLYNEPGNSRMGDKSLPLAEAAFAWARAARPSQPLTIGVWARFGSRMSRRLIELSDVLSFHGYDPPQGLEAKIRSLLPHDRPILCTECLRRQVGSTFQSFLPLFATHRIGWYNWGLVAGRTQTHLHWGSKKGSPMPTVWQHDLFHPDGRPYDPSEIELIKSFTFPRRAPRPGDGGP